ncbi:hypothetical protein Csa_015482, partial [Cucumis sativus]
SRYTHDWKIRARAISDLRREVEAASRRTTSPTTDNFTTEWFVTVSRRERSAALLRERRWRRLGRGY